MATTVHSLLMQEGMHATTHSGCLQGVEAVPVQVEARLCKGLPGIELVGLPERAVTESRVRVRAAIESEGLELPARRFVVNLAPGDLRKRGANFDLAVAMAMMAASGLVRSNLLGDVLLLGELSLSGEIRFVPGVLAQLMAAKSLGFREAIVPKENAVEAGLLHGIRVCSAQRLAEVVAYFDGQGELEVAAGKRLARGVGTAERPGHVDTAPEDTLKRATVPTEQARGRADSCEEELRCDLADVWGQESACRALEIAAAGGHNLLLVGPPGSGKSMLAERLPGLLPQPSESEALMIAAVASAAGERLPAGRLGFRRPFRSPHSSASMAAMVGGGDPVVPGEVTRAHGGVLFLDELPEFRRDVIESLRVAMERGEVQIVRAQSRVTMPARIQVVAAMNPCPCGYAGDQRRLCRCTPERVVRYQAKVSGPLLDRFDLHASVDRVVAGDLMRKPERSRSNYTTVAVRARVEKARAILRSQHPEQGARLDENAQIGERASELPQLLRHTESPAKRLLERGGEALALSARGYVRVLRVARTIAALESRETVACAQVAEALQYRLVNET